MNSATTLKVETGAGGDRDSMQQQGGEGGNKNKNKNNNGEGMQCENDPTWEDEEGASCDEWSVGECIDTDLSAAGEHELQQRYGARFPAEFTPEDAIGFYTFAPLEACPCV
jgi:hypothetical protein